MLVLFLSVTIADTFVVPMNETFCSILKSLLLRPNGQQGLKLCENKLVDQG